MSRRRIAVMTFSYTAGNRRSSSTSNNSVPFGTLPTRTCLCAAEIEHFDSLSLYTIRPASTFGHGTKIRPENRCCFSGRRVTVELGLQHAGWPASASAGLRSGLSGRICMRRPACVVPSCGNVLHVDETAFFRSTSIPARRNSSTSTGMSNLLELYPAKSHPSM